MPTLELGAIAIPYRLRRSRRALRLRITVRPDGVDVVAPLRAGHAEIAAFVARHGDWVQTKVGALRRTLATHPGPQQLAAGGRIRCAAARSSCGSRPAAAPGSRSAAGTASRSGCPSGCPKTSARPRSRPRSAIG